MGLPAIATDFDFEEQAQRIESDELLNDFYGAEKIRRSPQQFVTDQVEKLNKDQRAAFDRISSAILDGRGRRLFFVEGAGGCGNFFSVLLRSFSIFRVKGKTYLYNTLIRWILAGKPNITSQKLIATNEASETLDTINPMPMAVDNVQSGQDNAVQSNAAKNPLPVAMDNVQGDGNNTSQINAAINPLPMAVDPELLIKGKVSASASTGIAALLLIGGGTVHRTFNVPNDVDEKTQPRINAESKRAEQIRNTDLIIIDVIYSFCPFPRKLCDYTF